MSAPQADRFSALVDRELGPSRSVPVDQDMIDTFAAATLDDQWIHTDPERAARESPFGATVAHGMLTLSIAPRLALELLGLLDAKLVINYGLNRVRFPAPLPAGSRVSISLKVLDVTGVRGGVRLTARAAVNAEGAPKPVCVAELILQVMD